MILERCRTASGRVGMAGVFALAALLGTPFFAFSGPRDLIICSPSSPGTTEQAENFMKSVTTYIETTLSWPEGTMRGIYYPSEKAGLAAIEREKPGFAIVSVGFFLKYGERFQMIPFLQPVYGNATVERYYVVVKDPAFKTLGDLEGKRLRSNHLVEPLFLSRVVFRGKIDVETFFEAKVSRTSFSAIKAVAKGRADAVLLNASQYDALEQLPFASDLRAIFVSEPIPTAPVVALPNATAEDREKLAAALLGMKDDPEGRKILHTMSIDGFRPASPATYTEVIRLFQGGEKDAGTITPETAPTAPGNDAGKPGASPR
ncbi:MAG: hypothetical protein D6795_15830 [Deltaproteobacteria bacterium]|nr:MAG: hypothetical protein D6795_15830 [Deltaproteobacteria bacterium]